MLARGETPFVMAVMNSISLQPPMPSLRVGRNVGDVKRAERRIQREPAAEPVASFCLGTAWQDEQPPA